MIFTSCATLLASCLFKRIILDLVLYIRRPYSCSICAQHPFCIALFNKVNFPSTYFMYLFFTFPVIRTTLCLLLFSRSHAFLAFAIEDIIVQINLLVCESLSGVLSPYGWSVSCLLLSANNLHYLCSQDWLEERLFGKRPLVLVFLIIF